MAARSPIESVGVGYDVDENAVRFSNYFHVLRELVHLSCGWLPLEPRLRQLTQLLHRQERHVAELPAESAASLAFDDLGALPIRLREVRELSVMAPLVQPARDGYVEVTEAGDPYLTDSLYVNGDEN